MSIADNISKLRYRINKAALRVSRDPAEIEIVAVSKTVPVAKIIEAFDAGIRIIGENRVQEAKEKHKIININVEWHMVGHLQTNKVKDALKIFSLIHSLDSLKLAETINKKSEKKVRCLIEVNTSQEATKYGIAGSELFPLFESIKDLPNIEIQGLMTIGPGWAIEDPEASRACFRELFQLRDKMEQHFGNPFPILSMGMTSDFEIAVEEGSNLVRVGTAIFGARI